jgi:hypothetical protein
MFSDRLKGIGGSCEAGQDGMPRTRRWSRKLANKDFVLLPDFSSPLEKIKTVSKDISLYQLALK